MATGFMALFVTPATNVLQIPDGWTVDYASDVFAAKEIFEDRFVDFDHEPTPEEIAAELSGEEFEAELRQWDAVHRLRIRYPVQITTETRGGIARIYELPLQNSPGWGNKAVWWWVNSTAAKLKLLHTYINVTLGFGPVAGALAAVDPANPTKFLPNAVQTATNLTNGQQLTRVTSMRNSLAVLGYAATNLTGIVNVPAGKTEDNLIRALVADLGFTMPQLYKTMIRMD